MKKKILIISYSYPPSNVPAAQRPYTVAKYLDKGKFDVTVITCANADVSWGMNEGFNQELPDVKLIKINSLLGRGASALRRSTTIEKKDFKTKIKSRIFRLLSSMIVPDQAIFWYPKVRNFLEKNADMTQNVDIVFTTSPSFSNHLIGKFIKSINKNVLWISELRDFHFVETTDRVSNLKQMINKALENSVIRKSDKVSFISYAMRDIYSKHYPKFSKKFNVIYNGLDASDFEGLNISKTKNRRLTIFYAGSFYRGVRSPFPLLKILDKLIEDKQVTADEIEIRIAGNFESDLLEEVKSYKSYKSMNFLGNIPRSTVLSQLVSADLLWLIVGGKATHYTGVPIKFFEYLGARRPIINFAPEVSEPTRIIRESHLGWNFDTANFDLEYSAEIFENILEKHKSGKLSESLEKRDFPEFDRDHQGVLFGRLFMND